MSAKLFRLSKAELVRRELRLTDTLRLLLASHADLVAAQEHGMGVDLEWAKRIEIDGRLVMQQMKGGEA